MGRTGRAILAALALVGMASCGHPSPAEQAISETGANMSDIHSGDLTLKVEARAENGGGGTTVGFELSGPFAMPQSSQLPVADLTYTRIAGSNHATVEFLSTGKRAFVQVGGSTYQLPGSMIEQFRGGSALGSPLGDLHLSDWVVDPRLGSGRAIGGDPTDEVSGTLDVANAVNDLLDLAKQLGSSLGDLPRIEGDDVQRLQNAVRSATFALDTGKRDRLLRRVAVSIDFGPHPPGALRAALEQIGGVKVDFELTLSDPNRSVSVQEPSNPLPYSELGPIG